MPGIVDETIASPVAGQPGKAQIAVEGADHRHRGLRIENTLTDENGDDVRLKKGARVEVAVTSESKHGQPSQLTNLLTDSKRDSGF